VVPGLERLHRRDTRLDSYVDRYAARAHGMTASAIRALFAVANRPEVVSLAGGMPNITDLPLDVIGSIIGDLVVENGRQAMQYGSGQGEQPMREAICEVMKLEGISAHPDDVTVTVGSQRGLDLVTRLFCDPGDVVICEAPSYVGALGVFRAFQCEVVHVAMDDYGLRPARSARRSRRACRRQADQVPLHDPQFPQSCRRLPDPRAPDRHPGGRHPSRPDGCRGQPYGLLGFG
jgi:DNA-binding transcriptional MocR family regulator